MRIHVIRMTVHAPLPILGSVGESEAPEPMALGLELLVTAKCTLTQVSCLGGVMLTLFSLVTNCYHSGQGPKCPGS